MIIVAGAASEEPVAQVLTEASRRGVDVVMLEESTAADWNLEVSATRLGRRCRAFLHGSPVRLDEATGIYLRLTAPRGAGPVDELRDRRRQAAIALLCSWAEVAGGRVANRPSAMASNASKPYQGALIRAHGLGVPNTLVSNDVGAVRAFWTEYSRVIYKSTSGVRSVVHELTPADQSRLDRVRHLPTQFQRLLLGTNVRVHVMGLTVFACEVTAQTVDYRYREGGPSAAMRSTVLPDDLADRCVCLARELRLPLAGIDLFRDVDGHWWCFEVNPSPAYSCFAEPGDTSMAGALTGWLAGQGD